MGRRVSPRAESVEAITPTRPVGDAAHMVLRWPASNVSSSHTTGPSGVWEGVILGVGELDGVMLGVCELDAVMLGVLALEGVLLGVCELDGV